MNLVYVELPPPPYGRFTARTARALAHRVVNAARRHHGIKTAACCVCGATPAQAHHDDYRKLLRVAWLCRQHHGERDAEIGSRAPTGAADWICVVDYGVKPKSPKRKRRAPVIGPLTMLDMELCGRV